VSEDHDKRIAELERRLAESEKYRTEQEEQRKKELAEQELQRAEQEKQREIELGKQEQERAQQEKQRFASELVKKYGVSANEKPVEVEEAPAKKELTGVRWLLVSSIQLVFAVGLVLFVVIVVDENSSVFKDNDGGPPTQTSKSSTAEDDSPLYVSPSQAGDILRGCCEGAGGTWARAGFDCIIGGQWGGDAYAYEGCVGDGIIVRGNGRERPLRPRTRRGL
jgi:hypothetical protein